MPRSTFLPRAAGLLSFLALLSPWVQGAELPGPTRADVAYGPEHRQKLDFWRAAGDRATPVVIYFHGGSWQRRAKNEVKERGLAQFLQAGISVVSVDYRFIHDAEEAGVQPPVQWPLHDAARAVQFVRSRASEWKLDKNRLGLSGSSAGGCTALWLALHDDLANPGSPDPVERESTRPTCVGVNEAQTSLDPRQIRDWFGSFPSYGGQAFGFAPRQGESDEARYARMEAARERLTPWLREYSPIEHASRNTPPLCLFYPRHVRKDTTHGALFGIKLRQKLDPLGVECEVIYPGAREVQDVNQIEFLIRKLKP